MKNKLLALAAAAAIVFGTAAVPLGESGSFSPIVIGASAEAETEVSGDFEFKRLSSSRITITKYTGSDKNVTIPKTIDGRKVTAIGAEAFRNNDALVSVTIPDTVDMICEYAFYHCDNLSSVKLPADLLYIESYAFAYCVSLPEIEFPDETEEIDDDAFFNCTSLGSVSLPDSVTTLGTFAFSDCTSLEALKLSENLTAVPKGCFDGCEMLDIVVIPASVNSIGDFAFKSCSAMEVISFNNGLNSIGSEAFEYCDSLTSVVLPNTVTSIGGYAFSGCDRLKSVDLSQNLKYISQFTFNGCQRLSEITIPETVTGIYDCAFDGCSKLTSINIPSSVTFIGYDAFYGCPLNELTVPKSVEDIRGNAFGFSSDGNNNTMQTGTKIKVYKYSAGYDYCVKNELPFELMGDSEADDFDKRIFGTNSSSYNNDLAIDLAWACQYIGYSDLTDFYKYYKKLGFRDYTIGYSGDSYCNAVGAKLYDDDTVVMMITCRGSTVTSEFLGDFFTHHNSRSEFGGREVYDNAYEFYNVVINNIKKFYEDYPKYLNKKTKLIITGHSLGGACANLLAAYFDQNLTGSSNDMMSLTKDDIYCYTFGAIDSIKSATVDTSKYSNIHNVYNFYDSFGPYSLGGLLLSFHDPIGNVGTMIGKFGHMDTFAFNYYYNSFFKQFTNIAENHLIENYIKSLQKNEVSCRKKYRTGGVYCPVDVEITCGGKTVAKTVNNEIVENETTIPFYIYEDQKHFVLPDDQEYTINLTAYDEGTMDFFIEEFDDQTETYSVKVCRNVALVPDKQFSYTQSTEQTAEQPELFVIGENSRPEMTVDEEGVETPVEDDVILGDVNADGKVTMKDYSELQKFLSGWDVEIDTNAADLNGDGKVTMKDYAALQRKLNGYTD